MADIGPGDHALGIELQIVELVERKKRATAQGRDEEATQLQQEIEALHGELAEAAEKLTP